MTGTVCPLGHVQEGQSGQPLKGACPVVLLAAEMSCPVGWVVMGDCMGSPGVN